MLNKNLNNIDENLNKMDIINNLTDPNINMSINTDVNINNFDEEAWHAAEEARIEAEIEAIVNEHRYKFDFGKDPILKRACLQIRKTHSNLFMTLTDCSGCAIVTKTAAMVLGKLERRRRRKAPQTIENMITSFEKHFSFHKIDCLIIILRIRPGQYINNIIKSLKSRNILIRAIFTRRKLPFSFTRGRRKKY